MPLYIVKVTATLSWRTPIEAKTKTEAIKEAKRLFENIESDEDVGYGFEPGDATEEKVTYNVVPASVVVNASDGTKTYY